jgi:hypothetical protein
MSVHHQFSLKYWRKEYQRYGDRIAGDLSTLRHRSGIDGHELKNFSDVTDVSKGQANLRTNSRIYTGFAFMPLTAGMARLPARLALQYRKRTIL